MYELTAIGIVPDNQTTIEGRDGRAVQKPSVNARSASAQTVHDLLLVQASAISQVAFASLLFQNHTYNHYTVFPADSVDGLGKRRFASVQAVKNDIQRLAKSGKAPWLVRVESDLSVTDMSGNAWGYCHSLNMPISDETELNIQDAWASPETTTIVRREPLRVAIQRDKNRENRGKYPKVIGLRRKPVQD